jgi:Cu/Ag efflux protein CusF
MPVSSLRGGKRAMRKHLILSLTLIMVLVAAMAAMAADKPEPKYHKTSGDIVSVDATAQTFTISHGKENWTFKTDDATKVRGMGAINITLTDLKPGDNVRVSYTETASDKTAARIDVLHGKKSHA